MKKFLGLAVLSILSTNAMAQGVVAQNLLKLNVNQVSQQGLVLKSQRIGQTERVLVGINVKVALPSACVDVVGQETTIRSVGSEVIEVKGSSDPINDVCIQIMPMPVDMTLNTVLNVNLSLPVAQVSKFVTIGSRTYNVVLDLHTQKVSVYQLIRG